MQVERLCARAAELARQAFGKGPIALVAGAAALSCALVALSLADARGFRRLRLLQRDTARQEAANALLRAQNAELQRTIKGLSPPLDRGALERAAREQLGFVRADEILFKFE